MDLENELSTDLETPPHSMTEEERAYLRELDAQEDAEIQVEDKGAENLREQADMLALKAALPFAAKAIGFMDGMARMKDSRLGFTQDEKEMLTNAAAPVIVKYGAEPPAWLIEYGPELTLLGCIGLVGFNKLETLKVIQREEAEKKRAAMLARQKAQREAAQCSSQETPTIH